MESRGQGSGEAVTVASEEPDHPAYVSKARRLRTFENFPANCPVGRDELAEAGFFAAGRGDGVYCFYCGGGVRHWAPGDTAWEEHARHHPRCGFVRSRKGRRYVEQIQRKHKQDSGTPQVDLTEEARYPDLIYESERLRTYEGFPEQCPVKPKMLAKAGFSFTGRADTVVCFHCDQRLTQWLPGDDPWEDHARHSPKCEFLHMMKGSEYVEQVLAKFNLPHAEHSFPQVSSPFYPNYAHEADRLQTYKTGTFPARCPVTPKALARAGLFFTDDRDCVCCFSCGQKLSTWEPGDDAWEEHARFYPTCQFVQVMKGEHYVQALFREQDLLSYEENRSSQESTTSTPHSIPEEEEFFEMGGLLDSLNRLESEASGQTGMLSTSAPPTAQVRPPAHQNLPIGAGADENTLLEENRQLKQEKVCKVCLDNVVTIAFFPCGHLCCCDECGMAVPSCPICRAEIARREKVFLA